MLEPMELEFRGNAVDQAHRELICVIAVQKKTHILRIRKSEETNSEGVGCANFISGSLAAE